MTTEPIPLVVRRVIAAPRTRIFDAFASAETLSQWFKPSADIVLDVLEFDFRAGGRFRLRYSMPDGRQPAVGGVYERVKRPTQITLSWIWEAPDPLADIPMRVLFEFLKRGNGTEVVITHERVPSDQACTIHEDGWERSLDSLEHFLRMARNKPA